MASTGQLLCATPPSCLIALAAPGLDSLPTIAVAAPHVAGALALLLSTKHPGDSLAALKSTAMTSSLQQPVVGASSCGGTPWDVFPNNLYGWGLPDVCAAAKVMGAAC